MVIGTRGVRGNGVLVDGFSNQTHMAQISCLHVAPPFRARAAGSPGPWGSRPGLRLCRPSGFGIAPLPRIPPSSFRGLFTTKQQRSQRNSTSSLFFLGDLASWRLRFLSCCHRRLGLFAPFGDGKKYLLRLFPGRHRASRSLPGASHVQTIHTKAKGFKFNVLASRHREDGTLGTRIRNLRLRAGLQQKELAQKLGVDKRNISRWETNQKKPTAEELEKLQIVFASQVGGQ